MSVLSRPQFVTYDPDTITAELVQLYETIVGRTLYPAQPERLFIDVIAYRECLVRQAIQEAAEQNLVAYARDAALDQLGANVGVTRLAAQPADCTVTVTLTAACTNDTVIPAGLTLITSDSKFTFTTSEPCYISAGNSSGTCTAACTSAGPDANGYLPGYLHLQGTTAGVQTVTNSTTTANGTSQEDDDTYRERIPLALEAYSCTGPTLAYKYWAMSAHNSITDVAVVSPSAGVVNIYPLTADGAPSQALLQAVASAVNGEKRRPLTDSVQVLAPTAVHFTVTATVDLYGGSDSSAVLAKINEELTSYKEQIKQTMGRDVVPSQILALMHVDGVYRVSLTAPSLIEVDAHSYPVLDSWTITRGSVIYD